MDEKFGEIIALKSLLADTDYKVIKNAEKLLTCTSMTELLNTLGTYSQDVQEITRKRIEWRTKINEIEAEIENNNLYKNKSEGGAL